MKAYLKAIAAFAVAAVMCICPAFALADGSDAYTLTTGEQAHSVDIEDLSTEDIGKLYSSGKQTNLATEVAEAIVDNKGDVAITDVVISEMDIKKAVASKITDSENRHSVTEKLKFKITFTATFDDDGDDVFVGTYGTLTDVVVKAGNHNQSTAGDKLEITADVELTKSAVTNTKFTETEAADFVTTWGEQKESEIKSVDATVKYTYATTEGTSSFSFDFETETKTETVVELDAQFLETEAAKATDTTYVYPDWTVKAASYVSEKAKVDGESRSNSATVDMSEFYKAIMDNDIVQPASLAGENVQPDQIYWVGYSSETCLFLTGDLGDASLADDSAMNTFLASKGTVSTSYSDAKSTVDDNYESVSSLEDLVNMGLVAVIGILAILVVVLIIVIVIVLIVKRKKK